MNVSTGINGITSTKASASIFAGTGADASHGLNSTRIKASTKRSASPSSNALLAPGFVLASPVLVCDDECK